MGGSCPAQPPQHRAPGESAEQAEGQADPPTDGGGVPTPGGIQFWTDALLFHDWRIQRNAISGHYRLLDGQNRRHARGSFAHCRDELEQIKCQHNLPPMCGRVVILLHGLADPRSTMSRMANFLQTSGQGTVLYFAYASTQAEVAEHARALAQVIDNLEGVTEINFVAHSLGNLVIRHYFADQMEPATGRQPDPRIRRIVMLGPPNRGTLLAERLAPSRLSLFRGQERRAARQPVA